MPKKKGNGSGSYWKDGPVWKAEIMIGYKYVNGEKKKDVRRATKATAAEAQAFLRDAKVNKAQPVKITKMTMGELADAWYESLTEKVAARKLEESTRVGYLYTKNHIKHTWNERPVSDMTAAIVESGIDRMHRLKIETNDKGEFVKFVELPDKISFGYRKKVKSMLGQIFLYAARQNIIRREDNPMLLVEDLRNTEREKSTKDAYDIADIVKLIQSVPVDSPNPFAHALVVEIVGTYRRQEMLPLLKTDIEPDGSAIAITKAVKLMEKGKTYIGNTKTIAGERITYLPEIAWEHAKWLRDHADDKTGYVFYSPIGRKHIHPTTYSAGIEDALRESPVTKKLTVHELRHTAAKLWKNTAGISAELVMKQGGWSDRKTMDGYADHTHADELRDAAAVVNSMLTASLSEAKKQE